VVNDPFALLPVNVLLVLVVYPLRQTLDPGEQRGEKVLSRHLAEAVVVKVVLAFLRREAVCPL
jgi:hypothetical protein